MGLMKADKFSIS